VIVLEVQRWSPHGQALVRRNLSEAEIDKIVAFLGSLSSTEVWQPPKLP